MVGAVRGAGELFGCCEDARTDTINGEIYPSSGVEEVQARIEDGLIYAFEAKLVAYFLVRREFQRDGSVIVR